MLALTRKKSEAIRIGNDIEIRVLDIQGDKVRLGISAPAHVSIHRQEIYDKIREANREATATPMASLGDLKKMIKKEKDK